MNETTMEVLEALQSSETIPREDVRRWMKDDDLETLALVYDLTNKAWSRITPELSGDEQCAFMTQYLIECITIDRKDGDYVHSGFEAAWEFAAWLKHLDHIGASDSIIRRALSYLESAYRRSDLKTRNRIETGAVEHILERKPLRKYFEHWAQDPELEPAHRLCLEWGQAHEE
jgi:hypothetical protein